jgi:hypothetical protein
MPALGPALRSSRLRSGAVNLEGAPVPEPGEAPTGGVGPVSGAVSARPCIGK